VGRGNAAAPGGQGAAPARYAALVGGAPHDAAARLAQRLDELLAAAALPRSLPALGVDREALPELAGAAAEEWTSRYNPRAAGAAELLALYQHAYQE
jgi:alcohol dehydrogenase class IV